MKTQKIKLALLGMLWLCAASGAVHAGTVTYVYTDPQGTPLAEADAVGTITARFDYAPYGQSVASMGAAPNGPGYTGHVNDPDTGLVYMQARYYDPGMGRFLSVDPVGMTPGNVFNFGRYAYANNNPSKFTDPDGRCPDACVTEVSLGAVYVVATVLVAAGVCKVACGRVKDGIENGVKQVWEKIASNNEEAPALPTGIVGDEPRATGKYGGKAIGTSLPSDKFADTVKELTGGVVSTPDSKGRSTSPNGVSVRTGGKDGPRIEVPANGEKPPEIIHFPEDTPIPDNLKPTS